MLSRSFSLIFNGVITPFFCVAEQQIIIICTVFSLERFFSISHFGDAIKENKQRHFCVKTICITPNRELHRMVILYYGYHRKCYRCNKTNLFCVKLVPQGS